MKKTIKIEVEIERDFSSGMNARVRVYEMLFTDLSSKAIDSTEVYKQVKEALKMLKGYSMLTINVSEYESSYYGRVQDILYTKRLVNRYGKETIMDWIGDHYQEGDDAKKNTLSNMLSDAVNKMNSRFIELLQETSKVN